MISYIANTAIVEKMRSAKHKCRYTTKEQHVDIVVGMKIDKTCMA
jgi:hypothetical protein